MRCKHIACTLVGLLGIATAAQAGPIVGDIQGFYFVPTTQSPLVTAPFALQDGPVFVVENTGTSNITNGVLQIFAGAGIPTADSYSVGTVPVGGRVYVAPGLTNDGGAGHSFFTFMGGILDTSDTGQTSNSIRFEFTGLYNGSPVDSGIFTPAATFGPSNDGVVNDTNFLGNDDGPTNNVFGPKVIATLTIPAAPPPPPPGVPEPSTLLLLGTGLAGLFGAARRWRRRPA